MYCPSGHCLCRTVQLESIRIWNDLQDAGILESPLHEDTITQTLALSLNRKHGGQNRVHLFSRAEESKNGSDFLWVFFNSDLTRNFRVAVQAKRLYPGGRYEAFELTQARTLDAYARSISAVSVYVFYNFVPFLRGYYAIKGRRRYVYDGAWCFDRARDLGAIYVPTDDILRLSVSSLSSKNIAGTFRPLWQAFCTCESPKIQSPLDELAERFTPWRDAEERTAPGCQETDQRLRRWMEGGRIEEGTIEDLFAVSSVRPSEGFSPTFIMGTQLTVRENAG